MNQTKAAKLAIAFLLGSSLTLSACTGSGTKQPEQTGESAKPSATAGGTESRKEKLTLQWYVPAPPNTNLPAPDKDFVKQTIDKKFNVDLKLEYVSHEYINKINTLLASNPPDMWRDANGDGGLKYAADGLLADMTPFLSTAAMPNYFKYWINENELKNYQFQNQFVRAPIPFSKKVYRSYYIRKDWLDTLGLGIPANYAEYVNVLRQFRHNDPDRNGKKDTYGYTTAVGGDGIGLDWPEYIKNGLTFPFFIENNRMVDMQTDAKVEQVLSDIAKVIEEDLIDPDWFLNKGSQGIEKAIQGKIGVMFDTFRNFALDSNVQGIQARTRQLNPKAEWVPFTMFPVQPLATQPLPGVPFLFSKKVADSNPEKVKRSLEILDWMSGEEGFLLTHFGQENKHYTRDGKTIKLNIEAMANDITKQGDFLKIWSFFTPETPDVFGLTVLDPNETEHDRQVLKFLDALPVRENIGSSVLPPQGFDLGAFRKRQRELQAKAVLEEKSGQNWPKYRGELMTKYKGTELYQEYENQLKAKGMIK
ncbi:hypothetical protein ACFFNY_16755 [Paenibacillus hodogayensis]|uniref:Extracellular solute-binding protein n=1 Tax=Paenibacillus hodogayensis TaxID=279208 RepID=A0ABV5VY30_9BACL